MTQGLHADNAVKLRHDARKIEMFQLAKSLRCNAFGVSTPIYTWFLPVETLRDRVMCCEGVSFTGRGRVRVGGDDDHDNHSNDNTSRSA